MNTRQARAIREAIHAAHGTQTARDTWATEGPRRTITQLITLIRAHHKLVEHWHRTHPNQ